MYAVSDRWESAIRNSGKRITRVNVYNRWDDVNDEMVVGGTPLIEGLKIESASVTVDRQSLHRRTASLTVVDEDFVEVVKAFSPNLFGLEFEIFMGVEYGPGDEELVPMGIFMLNALDYTDGDEAIVLGLIDRSLRLTYYKLETIYSFAASRSITAIAHDFLDSPDYANFPGISLVVKPPLIVFSYDPGSFSVSDPMSFLQELVSSNTRWSGYEPAEIYFDVAGQLAVSIQVELLSSAGVDDAVWVFTPGDDGDLINAEVSLKLSGFINNVFVGWVLDESTGNTVGEFSWITGGYTDPTGPAGWRSRRYDAEPDDVPNLAELALAKLGQTWGIERNVSATGLGNPALDVSDIIGVTLDDGSIAIQAIETMTIDHSFQMQVQTRGKRL